MGCCCRVDLSMVGGLYCWLRCLMLVLGGMIVLMWLSILFVSVMFIFVSRLFSCCIDCGLISVFVMLGCVIVNVIVRWVIWMLVFLESVMICFIVLIFCLFWLCWNMVVWVRLVCCFFWNCLVSMLLVRGFQMRVFMLQCWVMGRIFCLMFWFRIEYVGCFVWKCLRLCCFEVYCVLICIDVGKLELLIVCILLLWIRLVSVESVFLRLMVLFGWCVWYRLMQLVFS